ncbi:hypothetical protein GOBAR_DD04260 [Gossypium barbadense]|nr:hypothetical protein GOBAR_DD04260 [Gossypium barbadense]
MIDVGLIIQDSEEVPKGVRNYYEFHAIEGHEIQYCIGFKALVQSLMDNKEVEFFVNIKGSKREDVCISEEGSTLKVYKPRDNEVEVQATPRIIIQKSVALPYKDSERVP